MTSPPAGFLSFSLPPSRNEKNKKQEKGGDEDKAEEEEKRGEIPSGKADGGVEGRRGRSMK